MAKDRTAIIDGRNAACAVVRVATTEAAPLEVEAAANRDAAVRAAEENMVFGEMWRGCGWAVGVGRRRRRGRRDNKILTSGFRTFIFWRFNIKNIPSK